MSERSSQEKGTSLLEVLVAFSILAIALVGVTYFYQHAAVAKKHIRTQAAQEALAHDIRSKLQTSSALYASLLDPANTALIRCVVGVEDGCTEALTSLPQTEADRNLFTLHHATDASTSEVISSIYYSDIGKRNCDPAASNCIFKVETFFYALCPIGEDPALGHPSACKNGAQEVRLGYSVSQVKAQAGEALLPTLPRLVQFYPLAVLDILGIHRNATCNPGAVATGYSETGEMSCSCKLPYITSTLMPNRNGPLCSLLPEPSYVCKEGLIYHGLDENGVPICKSFSDSYACITLSGDEFEASNGTCGDGYWIQGYTRGTCSFYCVVGAEGGACNSWETSEGTDTRVSGGYLQKSFNSNGWGRTEKGQVTPMLKPGQTLRIGSAASNLVKNGMVCTGGSISCCQQK